MIGLPAVPSTIPLLSFQEAGGGSLTFRQVACRAKQGRYGAKDAFVETVEMDEIEEALDERDRSEIMDSGLEREDAELVMDGRRDVKWLNTAPG